MSIRAIMPTSDRARASWSIGTLIAAWLVVVASGWCWVANYEFTINEPAAYGLVAEWPADSELERSQNLPTLVLFLHPKCPCSRATLHELNDLLKKIAASGSPLPAVLVVATVPKNAGEEWLRTDTVAQSENFPRGTVFIDHSGVEAARFGAMTSGTMMLFDASGARRFAGGITISRGHEGQSAGGDLLAGLLRGESGANTKSRDLPVFGCRLCLPVPVAGDDLAEHGTHQAAPTKSSI
jgi:hypothetical protein